MYIRTFSKAAIAGNIRFGLLPNYILTNTLTADINDHDLIGYLAKLLHHEIKKLILLLSIIFFPVTHMIFAQERPNIIYILVDDLGYGDVNFDIEEIDVFKNPNIKTPNLASLASQGLVFTHHYSASPVCSPSRAGLLTGRVPTRCNINTWIRDIDFDGEEYLRDEEVTIAEKCLEAGYVTAIFGKWHLNCADWSDKKNWNAKNGTFPNQQGFQYGMVSKENPHLTVHMHSNSQKNPGDYYSVNGEPMGTIKGYTSSIITDSALAFLHKSKRNHPFFLYLPYDAPHERIYNPDKFDAMYHTGDPNKDAYYANVAYLDHQIGRLLSGLKDMSLEKNTIVFFSSDNGPEVLRRHYLTWRSYGTSYPLNGQKRTVWEGGIRVPGIVRWPGRIKPAVSSAPNSTLDIMPTLCELIGVKPPSERQLDGSSMVDLMLNGNSIKREKPLYWQFDDPDNWIMKGDEYNSRYDGEQQNLEVDRPSVVLRSGNYVLRGIYQEKFMLPDQFVLYDVVNDRAEKNELSVQKPEIFNELKNQLIAIHKSVNTEREELIKNEK